MFEDQCGLPSDAAALQVGLWVLLRGGGAAEEAGRLSMGAGGAAGQVGLRCHVPKFELVQL